MGYWRAGFQVVGVDSAPQPHYPFDFYQADVFGLPDDFLRSFDVVHASPPCQDHSDLVVTHEQVGTAWMLEATIDRLLPLRIPWVVENVEGRSVVMGGWYVTLCGSSLGLPLWRHRRFGSNVALLAPGCRHELVPEPVDVTGHSPQGRIYRRRRVRGEPLPEMAGDRRDAMGITWMNRDELSQAIPPAYTEYLGAQLMACVA